MFGKNFLILALACASLISVVSPCQEIMDAFVNAWNGEETNKTTTTRPIVPGSSNCSDIDWEKWNNLAKAFANAWNGEETDTTTTARPIVPGSPDTTKFDGEKWKKILEAFVDAWNEEEPTTTLPPPTPIGRLAPLPLTLNDPLLENCYECNICKCNFEQGTCGCRNAKTKSSLIKRVLIAPISDQDSIDEVKEINNADGIILFFVEQILKETQDKCACEFALGRCRCKVIQSHVIDVPVLLRKKA